MRRLIDHHQGERRDGVDATQGEPGRELMQELDQTPLLNSRDMRGARNRRCGSSPPAPDHDAAGLDQIGAVGQIQRQIGVLLDDQETDAIGPVDRAQDFENVGDDQRREAERGFVEQQQAGSQQQRARDREHLLLASRERAGLLAPALREPRKIPEDPLEIRLDRVAILADVGAEPKVLLDGQIGERAPAVGHVRDAQPRYVLGSARGHRRSPKVDPPRAADHRADRAQDRGLPRSVGAQQRRHSAVFDQKIDAENDLNCAIERLEGPRLQNRRRHAALPR